MYARPLDLERETALAKGIKLWWTGYPFREHYNTGNTSDFRACTWPHQLGRFPRVPTRHFCRDISIPLSPSGENTLARLFTQLGRHNGYTYQWMTSRVVSELRNSPWYTTMRGPKGFACSCVRKNTLGEHCLLPCSVQWWDLERFKGGPAVLVEWSSFSIGLGLHQCAVNPMPCVALQHPLALGEYLIRRLLEELELKAFFQIVDICFYNMPCISRWPC